MDQTDIDNRFEYHAPDDDKRVVHEEVRAACLRLATQLNDDLPDGREKSLAITKLEEVMFWANAAIARN